MKHLPLTTIAAVVLVGCGPPKPPDISIHKAAFQGNIEAVKQHIAAGTDVNAKDFFGKTPLHHAVNGSRKETVNFLLAKGADVNAMKTDGMTPLDMASMNSHNEVADLLRKHGGKTKKELKAEGK